MKTNSLVILQSLVQRYKRCISVIHACIQDIKCLCMIRPASKGQIQNSIFLPFSVIITGGFPYRSFTYFTSFRMPHGTMCSHREAAWRRNKLMSLLNACSNLKNPGNKLQLRAYLLFLQQQLFLYKLQLREETCISSTLDCVTTHYLFIYML